MSDIFSQANRVQTAQRQSRLSMTAPYFLKTRTALQSYEGSLYNLPQLETLPITLVGSIKHAAPAGAVNCQGVLPNNRLMGMCRWMGSHFHDWIDCDGVVVFNRVTRMGSHIFGILGVRKFRLVGI